MKTLLTKSAGAVEGLSVSKPNDYKGRSSFISINMQKTSEILTQC